MYYSKSTTKPTIKVKNISWIVLKETVVLLVHSIHKENLLNPLSLVSLLLLRGHLRRKANYQN